MKSLLHRAPLFLLCIAFVSAEPPGIDQSLEFVTPPTGAKFIRWHGKPGRSYFVQVSDPANHLNTWHFEPIIEGGNDEDISYEVDGTADKGFFRLKYTDQVPGTGETLETADFDGDKVNNYTEIGNGTDPLLYLDTDGDGMPNDWETAHGFDPNNPADAMLDYDLDGNSNAQEYQQNTDPRDYVSRALPLIAMYQGDEQVSSPSSRLPIAMAVRVTDTFGLPLSNVPIQFNVTSGGGLLVRSPDDPQPSYSLTLFSDKNGFAGSFYIQPNTLNTTSSISATVTSGLDNSTITFTTQTVALPANDNFADSQLLTGNEGSVNSTNCGASIESIEPTFLTLDFGAVSPQGGNVVRQTGATVWFTWQAPETRKYRFQTGPLTKLVDEEPATFFGNGTDFDTVLAIYQGASLQTLTLVAGNDDSETVESGVEFNATAGQTYYTAIDGAEGQVGKFFLNWLPVTPPSPPGQPPTNDAFDMPQVISGSDGVTTGTTVDATKQAGEPNHQFHEGQHSVWYSWQSSETGTVTFDTAGSEFNTIIGGYQGTSIANLSELTWNDDNETLRARISFEATEGQTYMIMVDGFGNDAGPVRLSWHTVPQPPANDNFGSASILSENSGTVSGTIRGATAELGEPSHAGRGPGQSIWYQWTAPESETYTFRTTGSEFDTVLAVYTGPSVNALTEVASNDDGDGLTSLLSFEATQGTTYLIVIDIYAGTLPQGQSGASVLGWMQGVPALGMNAIQTPSKYPTQFIMQNPLLLPNIDIPIESATTNSTQASTTDSEDPPEPNKGDTFVSGDDTTIIMLAPKEGEAPPTNSCPVKVDIIHSIVTINTPRARDLQGQLRLFLDGDSTLISLGDYTPGTPISVTEPGHVGTGIHDWHRGIESFNITSLKKGSVTLRAEVDPDAESPEGDGEPRTKATIELKIVEVNDVVIYHPSTESDTDWQSSSKALRWNQIIDKSEPLKIKLSLSSALPENEKVDLCPVKFALFKYDDDPEQANWVDLSQAQQRLSPNRTEVWVTVPAATVEAALTPFNSSENEYASIEAPGSGSFSDSDAFDAKAKLLANSKHLVPARASGNETDQAKTVGGNSIPPYTANSTGDYPIFGGAVYIQVKAVNTLSKRRLYRNQADILYISGHGTSRDGAIASVGPGSVDWDDDLETVIMAGCSVLDVNDYNGNYDDDNDGNTEPGPTSKVFSGEQWAATGPHFLLGYNYKAPLDSQGSSGIINSWFDNRGAGDVDAWRIANNISAGRNACAIDAINEIYYYFKKKKGFFYNSYEWTAVPKSSW